MTEQTPPAGSAPRPIPDLGFFGNPVAPARSQPAPPSQHAAPPDQFGAAPVTSFGAAPPTVYSPYPAVQQRGGLPGWAIALIAVGVSGLIVMVLAAIAIPTFLNQRAKATAAATTVALPDRIDGLERVRTAEAEAAIQAQVNSVPTELLRDTQGAAYSDGDEHTVFIQVSRFTRVANARDVDDVLTGFHRALIADLPPGVTSSKWQDRPSGPLGGRISCVTLHGDMTGQVCAAVESTTLLAVVDLAPSAAVDPDLPRRVREAVVHRQS